MNFGARITMWDPAGRPRSFPILPRRGVFFDSVDAALASARRQRRGPLRQFIDNPDLCERAVASVRRFEDGRVERVAEEDLP